MRFRTDVSTLFRVLPQAKYVIFSPLWHFQRECWFAATLGWVTDQTQAIDVADINLLTAFGNSMVAEVSRFEALAISRKKSDFISSISHELRSPLHGILASSELLRDAIEDPLLLSIIDMIDSCGTTLLDTFNNILDHANINNSGHVSGDPNTNLQLVDLSELVEDVVEAVKVSHASEATFQLAINKGGDSANLHPSPELADNSMLVTLNIERGLKTAINVGAWKRIVTNVVGNALKYTSSGHIEVSLTRVQRTDAGELCDQVCFAVQDTGIGMSSDYLKYELFTPFSQDNSLSPGIGLGLSIVQQLVRGLRGTVEVTSSVGVGTCVKVLVPLDQGPHTPRPTIADTEHSDAVAILRGRTVCLVAVDAYTAQTSSVPNRVGETRTRSSAVEKTIRQIAGDALGMTISLATWDFPIPEADIYVLDAETLDGAESNLSTLKPLDLSPVFTLCSSPGSSQCLEQRALSPDAVHLHHSIGPTKLASVFSAALATKSAAGDQPLNPLPRASPAATEYSVIPIHSTSLHTYNKVPAVLEKPVQDVPLSEDLAENTRVAPHLQRSSPRYHVLIVDDNPINVKLLAAVVRKLDHTFATARNGLEAVQLYRNSLETQRPFDLVFMDISMPIMNGFEATREIRQLEEDLGAARCRVVVLTGLSSETTRRAAVVSGTDMFLTKPVKLEKVKRLLDTEFG
jgi:signal transduction histidine kinase/ActR/RegA family two-component response regulator